MRDDRAYELIDAGAGARLERFGARIVERPAPAAIESRRDPLRWRQADLLFRPGVGWVGEAAQLDPWEISVDDLTLGLRPGAGGQVGFFPEHALLLPWLGDQVARRRHGPMAPLAPTVLNLFAGSGLATLALARAGAAVTHVDASRPALADARRNAERSGLADTPIRWIADDARAYVEREARRARHYDGLVLDPPSFGRGGGRRTWEIERDLPALLRSARACLAEDAFVLLTAHSRDVRPGRIATAAANALGWDPEQVTLDPLVLSATSGARLELGFALRFAP